MAIPFYEHEEEQTQQQQSFNEEVDQVDGHVFSSAPNSMQMPETPPSTPPPPPSPPNNEEELMAWKLLAMAMCKALKDHYQQNMSNNLSNSATAVIQILPNGAAKPTWH